LFIEPLSTDGEDDKTEDAMVIAYIVTVRGFATCRLMVVSPILPKAAAERLAGR
jgi:hypothetical protein